MCKWGTEKVVRVKIPAGLSHTGESYTKNVGIDACIASLVEALQAAGIETTGCCCGHGERWGDIGLADGRTLFVSPRTEDISDMVFNEVVRQPYQDMTIAAGYVEGHPHDTVYLSLERPDRPECSYKLLLRKDEALAILWALAGTLWSQEIGQVPAPLAGL